MRITRQTKTFTVYRPDHDVAGFDQLDQMIRDAEADQGGAWSFAVTFGMADLVRAGSPSQIPNSYYGLSGNRIFYAGEWQTFTAAAIIHEQNVGIGRG